MGGSNSGRVNGQYVQYGDLCEVEVWYDADGPPKKVLARFSDMSDDGDAWFCCVCEHEYVSGDKYFSDYMVSVGDVRVIGLETPEMFCGDGI